MAKGDKHKDTKDTEKKVVSSSSGMTQEELITEIDSAFYVETGMMTVVQDLSDLIDTYAEDDFQHYQFVSFFEWVLRLSQERDDG